MDWFGKHSEMVEKLHDGLKRRNAVGNFYSAIFDIWSFLQQYAHIDEVLLLKSQIAYIIEETYSRLYVDIENKKKNELWILLAKTNIDWNDIANRISMIGHELNDKIVDNKSIYDRIKGNMEYRHPKFRELFSDTNAGDVKITSQRSAKSVVDEHYEEMKKAYTKIDIKVKEDAIRNALLMFGHFIEYRKLANLSDKRKVANMDHSIAYIERAIKCIRKILTDAEINNILVVHKLPDTSVMDSLSEYLEADYTIDKDQELQIDVILGIRSESDLHPDPELNGKHLLVSVRSNVKSFWETSKIAELVPYFASIGEPAIRHVVSVIEKEKINGNYFRKVKNDGEVNKLADLIVGEKSLTKVNRAKIINMIRNISKLNEKNNIELVKSQRRQLIFLSGLMCPASSLHRASKHPLWDPELARVIVRYVLQFKKKRGLTSDKSTL